MDEPKLKSFNISKRLVWEAYQKVAANKGAAGVDGQSIAEFEQDLKGNLFKLWNRLSSGSYFPPPVRAVEIPKKAGGTRLLGVPTVADRIAQTVVCMVLEPEVEPMFHADSYGYRPGRSALDALAVTRRRCWENDWVIDLDIRAFFDTVPWDLVLKAVERHTTERWILLYVRRWLEAPLQRQDGTVVERTMGTPQGSAISPLLANLFMHYAFDAWMARTYPSVTFERYCDDVVVHCRSKAQAEFIRDKIAARLAECGLALHPDKTRIVYCKDANRAGSHEYEQFTFLGYTFRPRQSFNTKLGTFFVAFLPGVSRDAVVRIRHAIRAWRIHRRSDMTFADIVEQVNRHVAGWIAYYGRFYKSALYAAFYGLNEFLVRWAMRKYKKLRRRPKRAWGLLAAMAQRSPRMFAHWRFGALPATTRTTG
ncbi:group II intron reverse transcriptase/maturase [Nonomuraea sp. NPDC050451]|uniref:group II intron reverse transcriptase/maturase n=1 Tax=Nonomuraea sp. NPDC050451 TaxID=3364364 RepID=UPI00379ED144